MSEIPHRLTQEKRVQRNPRPALARKNLAQGRGANNLLKGEIWTGIAPRGDREKQTPCYQGGGNSLARSKRAVR